jgi:hypothetical protein
VFHCNAPMPLSNLVGVAAGGRVGARLYRDGEQKAIPEPRHGKQNTSAARQLLSKIPEARRDEL